MDGQSEINGILGGITNSITNLCITNCITYTSPTPSSESHQLFWVGSLHITDSPRYHELYHESIYHELYHLYITNPIIWISPTLLCRGTKYLQLTEVSRILSWIYLSRTLSPKHTNPIIWISRTWLSWVGSLNLSDSPRYHKFYHEPMYHELYHLNINNPIIWISLTLLSRNTTYHRLT